MTSKPQPVKAPPATREEPKPAPKTETPPVDPWLVPCAKCGLLGCVAGHT